MKAWFNEVSELPLLLVLIRLICRRRFGCFFCGAALTMLFRLERKRDENCFRDFSYEIPSLLSITHSSFAACALFVCVYLFSLRMGFSSWLPKTGLKCCLISDISSFVSYTLTILFYRIFHPLSLCCCCSFSSFGTHKNFAKQTRNDLKGRKKAAAAASNKKKSIERVSEKLIWPAKNNRQQKSEREIRDLKPVLIKKIYIYLFVC